ncbi:MAG: hypothetical protein OEW43_06505, partial [Elusimicrobiota bacterium]|nr:hypothetical protein [Elusimicrobiota bacterium]
PRKKRTDFEKAIAGIIGALRPASLVVQGPSLSISSAIDCYFETLIADSKLAPAGAKEKLTYLKKKWQGEHSDFAEFLREKWQIAIDRGKSGELIEKVDFLPVLLTKGKKAFALGIVKATRETSLPFVLKYNAEDGEVSEIIYGVEGCRRFLSSASFDNAIEDGSVAFGKLSELWPFLVKDISVPGDVDSKTVVSMKRTAPKVLRLPVVFSKGILSNAAFGNIGWWLHRRTGGLNDLIEKLFKQEKDVTGEEEFDKVKSAGTLSRRVVESLNMLKYENLNLIDKIVLKVRKIVTLGRSGIWNEKEFDRKKEELQKFSIYYLDSGKNLFWVKGKYAAAHYGVRNTSAYISAGFARKAPPMQLLGVATHEALHILGFSHRHAHKIARKRRYSISFGAKELMDELAKDDQKEEARTSLLDSIYDFLKKLAVSIFSYINIHPVTSFEKGTTTLLRDRLGRFIHHRGKSPEEARFVIALSDLWEKEWFILKEYGEAYKVVGSMLGFESLAAKWEQIARGDLQKLVEAGFLKIDEKEKPYKYRVTPEGKAECLEIRASLLEEDMGGPLSRASILREARNNPSANRARLLERLNAFIDSEIPLEHKRADLRRRLR